MVQSLLHAVELLQTWLIETETAKQVWETRKLLYTCRHSNREPGCMEATTQGFRAMWTEFTLVEEASGKSQSQQIIVLAI